MQPFKKIVAVTGVVIVLLATIVTAAESAPQKDKSSSSVKKIKKVESPSSPKKKPPTFPPFSAKTPELRGYCCAQGIFFSQITKTDCQRKKGNYSNRKEPLKSNCGWCCKDGRVRSVSSSEEKKKRCVSGTKLYRSEGLADRNCGWCCTGKGVVVASLKSQCDPKKFHQKKSDAEKQCRAKRGHCTVGDKIFPRLTKAQCDRRKGEFFKTRMRAQANLQRERSQRVRVGASHGMRMDIRPPRITSIVPADGSTVYANPGGATVTFTIGASDDVGIRDVGMRPYDMETRAAFSVARVNQPIADSTEPYRFTFNNVPLTRSGYSHEFEVTATDTAGKKARKRTHIYVVPRPLMRPSALPISQEERGGSKDRDKKKRMRVIGEDEIRQPLYESALPDLIITGVWVDVDRRCQIWIKVKNQGDGGISDADHANAKISFVTGSGTEWERPLPPEKRYLRVIDPGGVLKHAGGEVSYNTGLSAVVSKQWYKAMVDNTFQISESNEGNNERIGTFKKCAGAGLVAPPRLGPDTSETPVVLPDLKVLTPWTDWRCNLWIKVRNNGLGSIDPDDHGAAEVHVTASEPYRELPGEKMYLHVIDPSGQLLTPGGEVSYNTGIVIDDSDNISVYVDRWNTIAEVDDRGNNQFYGALSCSPSTPPFGVKKAKTDVRRIGKTSAQLPLSSRQKVVEPSASDRSGGEKNKAEPKKDARLLQDEKRLHVERFERRDEDRSSSYFWPIIISPPNSSSTYTAGDTIQGRYRIEISEDYAETMEELGVDVEIGPGQIHFGLMAGWDPTIPAFAETSVSYTPPGKTGGRSMSIMGIFSIPIPSDLSHSSNYRIIGYHEGSHWSVMGGSSSFTIRPLIGEEGGIMKKPGGGASSRGEEMAPAPEMSAERIIPLPVDHTTVQAPPRPGPGYPARISSVNCPVIPGNTLIIDGNDFGVRQGIVDIVLPDRSSHSCAVSSWSDSQVQCVVPREMGDDVGRSAVDAVVWLKPASILRPPGVPDDSETYYYNGSEGPSYVCALNPLEADCRGVDLVLNKIEVRRSGSTGCVAKVWISQRCEGETTVESFFAIFSDRGEIPAGWSIDPGWSGPSGRAYESGWLMLPCGTITGQADYNGVESEVNERNNECSVTIRGEMETVSRTCYPF